MSVDHFCHMFIMEKACPDDCNHSFHRISFKLAHNQHSHKVSVKFDFEPDRIMDLRVICPWALGNLPICLYGGKACPDDSKDSFHRISFKLAHNQHSHKISVKFDFEPDRIMDLGVICPWALKNLPICLYGGKACPDDSKDSFHRISFKLAHNQHSHKISVKFDFEPDRIINFGVICPWALRNFPHMFIMEKTCLSQPLISHQL